MREWLPEDDLVFVVLDAVATLDLGEFRRRYRADGHGRAAFDPAMMVALLLYGYCQGERSSRVIEKRCVRDVGYRVITGGCAPITRPSPGSGPGMRRRCGLFSRLQRPAGGHRRPGHRGRDAVRHPVGRTLLHPLPGACRQQLTEAGITRRLRTVLADAGYVSEETFARADADGLRLLAPLANADFRGW